MHSRETDDLINQLTEQLTPAKRLSSPFVRSSIWIMLSIPAALGLMWYIQPFRNQSLDQLFSVPRFGLEIAFGYLASILAIVTGFVLAVPGANEERMLQRLTALSFTVWALLFTWSIFEPSLEPTMAGKREGCFYEAGIYGLVLGIALSIFHRRSAFLKSGTAAFYIGLGCGLVPAVTMQLACMYIPMHGLTHHYAPALAVALISFFFGRKLLPSV